jgi:arylsulfatase A-like enzyme
MLTMPDRPNVLILHADQQRYDSLGCTGNPHARTPNLDRLAAEGTVFTRHISSNTICMPSRASLFTGLYPPGHNVWTNGVPLNRRTYARVDTQRVGEKVRPEPPTLADVFAAAGYDTVALGKLHLTPNLAPPAYGFPETWARWEGGALDDWHGPYYGFRHVELTQGHGEQPCHRGHYAAWLQREHPEVYRAVAEGREQHPRPIPALGDLYPSPVPAELHNTTWLADRFRAYLDARPADRPFFAFIGFPDPHHPFTPSFDVVQDFLGAPVRDPVDPTGELAGDAPLLDAGTDISGLTPEQRRMILRYTYAMVHQIDRAVGRVVEGLQAAGVWDDTVVIFTSDHGDFLGDHGRLRKGYTPCDPLLHLPFILRAGRRAPDLPARVAAPMSNVDVLPTLAALAGITPPAWCHGRDIAEVVRSGAEHRALAYCANGLPAVTNYTLYDAHHRFSLYPHTGYMELYDHREDPGECHNRAAERPDRVARMRRVIEASLLQHRTPILARVSAW